jgi:predicted nuclease of restriction endonuclease-like (RecB) superfamily
MPTRHFYEAEAVRANWSRRDLERQINSLYHQRLLVSADKTGVRQGQRQSAQSAARRIHSVVIPSAFSP